MAAQLNDQKAALRLRIAALLLKDRHVLLSRLTKLNTFASGERLQSEMSALETFIESAEQRGLKRKRFASIGVNFPASLPVSQKQPMLAEAISQHQVVIVAGETGSGKTTQLPKICLALKRGTDGLIGHTQPRRLAARTVAERIAEELQTPLGTLVGYQVRFHDNSSEETRIKLMTDGILLAEIQRDRLLLNYDTLIIDEAHERSLNIDFILGYLRDLLPKRPDLKVIITSATIDPTRFSNHFNNAPIIEVSGRTFPVEVRYRPLIALAEDKRDQLEGIIAAVTELNQEPAGDILVFLSGEREIRDTAEALAACNLHLTEIVPLYSRLSNSEQNRVFKPHTGRRIVLATNVAETSLTVPGIKYVIDPGTARISRYSHRNKVQRLPIEPISQASANQRKGRCGRVSEGICIRLYEESDFNKRPAFTDPEILRTNLAAVILKMTALGLGDIQRFPFIEKPDKRFIQDGIRLLEELGALAPAKSGQPQRHLTETGKILANLPIDPRLGKMVLAAQQHGCVRETMIITAALSIQDPRERPADKKQLADEMHRRFAHKDSDFLSWVQLWDFLQQQQKEASSSQFRRQCQNAFLNPVRLREWQDIYTQLRQVVRESGLRINQEAATFQQVHRALLAGLLSHIGKKAVDKKEYIGARQTRFALFPTSALFKKSPNWIMVAELVETSRLWGRIAGKIEPEWIEPLAKHLLKYSYSEPHWEQNQGAVMAFEKATLYGLPVVAARKVNYSSIDPVISRTLFIRQAMIAGEWFKPPEFIQFNRQLYAEILELENKSRRRNILVDDDTLYEFYAEKIPEEIVSVRHFDRWWQTKREQHPDWLNYDKALLIRKDAEKVTDIDYPDYWYQGSHKLKLSYQFEPGKEADGVTVHIPLPLLNQIEPNGFDWQVPGLREQRVISLIKSLPKALRRNFVPAPNYATAFLQNDNDINQPLLTSLERALRRMTGVTIPPDAWRLSQLPEYLNVTFRVIDNKHRSLGESKQLSELQQRLKTEFENSLRSPTTSSIEKNNITQWNMGTLPLRYQQERAGFVVESYPALVDERKSVAIKLFATEQAAQQHMHLGLRRLLLLNIPSPVRYLQETLPNKAKLGLYFNPYGTVLTLIDDCITCATDQLMAEFAEPVLDEAAFLRLKDKVRAELNDKVAAIAIQVEQVLSLAFAINKRLKGRVDMNLTLALADIKSQMQRLIYSGFATGNGWDRLADCQRYLNAIERRLDKLPQNINNDRLRMIQVQAVEQQYLQWRAKLAPTEQESPKVIAIRWMIEELRVSLFAQVLGTPYSISDKRILQQMQEEQ